MINAIFVVAIFLLQSQKDVISITWPYPDNAGNPQKLEPLALLFMVLFVGKKQHALKKYDHFALITGLLFLGRTSIPDTHVQFHEIFAMQN